MINNKISFTAFICGGRGDDLWDRQVYISGDDLTILEALKQVEANLAYDEVVVRIEQDD